MAHEAESQEVKADNQEPKGNDREAAQAANGSSNLALPVLVFGMAEIRRLKREIASLEDYMEQAKLRESGKQQALPKVSRMLDSLANENNLNLLKGEDRSALRKFLEQIEKSAPEMHFSFASDPSSAFMAKLVSWLRSNIHPLALINVGLQPSIAAGCVLRTPNKEFDFSLKARLAKSDKLLRTAMDATNAGSNEQQEQQK